MSLINHKELKKQIASGELTSLVFAIDGLNGFDEAIKAVYPKAGRYKDV